ncbi:kinase-like domain-containing protein [Mycena maculata]|uniref:Kinase-like domain-containing protein n=1 Tax=Mycena maculata TaxID=230809 RepID=A0AAD7IQD0_9AGAR|nr:kinase-like domain-containing protein [Mycena maculata]
MQKLSGALEQLPSSLFIGGVSDYDAVPTFHGGFGDVYRASYQESIVAVKRIRSFTANAHRARLVGLTSPHEPVHSRTLTISRFQQFLREALVWQGLNHRFILPLIGIDRDTFADSFCMVSPWMKQGTVLKYLETHGRTDVDRLLLEIAQGLEYLHSKHIVHGDLRGANILISDDGHGCLADFGLSTIISEDISELLTSSSNRAGSVRWFAPELISPVDFGCPKFARTPASDVYAYACVCVELYTGRPPFADVTPETAAMLRVIRGERPRQPVNMSEQFWRFVSAGWAPSPGSRPTVVEILASFPSSPR